MTTDDHRLDVAPAGSETGDPLLLTPGPLTISSSVKQAMQHDYGSRDERMIALTRWIRDRLVDVVAGSDAYQCVPVQGSGTFAIEATLGSLVPAGGKVLVLINGAYGQRIATICKYQEQDLSTVEVAEDTPVDPLAVDQALTSDDDITHVAVVYCETTTGLRNPIGAIAETVAAHDRRLIIDAMSAFGALPLDVSTVPFDAVVASANKCLEGPPGFAFSVVQRDSLAASEGNAPSLSLDLYDQWAGFERTGQWRFTPPTHALLGFEQALHEFHAEGGVEGRGNRYRRNCGVLIEGMLELGFETFLKREHQAPIIVTFHTPLDPAFSFDAFYSLMRSQGYVIYPGKLTMAETFRIGCIGRIDEDDLRGAVSAVARSIDALGVEDLSFRPPRA